MAEKRERPDGTVNFGCDDTLGHEASAHSHPVLFPLAHGRIHVQRSEEGHIASGKIVHHEIAHSSMSHVHDGCKFQRISTSAADETLHAADGIDIVAGGLQLRNKFFRLTHLSGDYHSRRVFLVDAVRAQVGFVFRKALEHHIAVFRFVKIGMVEYSAFGEYRFAYLILAVLAVDDLTDIFKHVAVIRTPSPLEI